MRPALSSLLRSPLCALGLLGVLLMLPALLLGPGATHSHQYNYMWTGHFGTQIAAGHFYERWLPASFAGLGSPTFYFYPPLAYWISGAFHALGLTIFHAISMTGLFLMVGSGLAMHRWLAPRTAMPLLGAALYMVAPYHLYDFYVRGALAEFAAFLWLPLIAIAIDRLPDRRGVLLLALAYGGLLLSHLPLAMLTGLFLIAPLMVHRLWRDRSVLWPGLLAGLIAFGLAASYLLPALTLQDHVSVSMLWGQDYRATDWSVWNASFALFPCLAIGLMLLAWPARSLWTAIALFAALASIRLIPFLWDISLLDKVQFPWRAFCIAEFAAITALMSARPRPLLLAGAGIVLLFPYLFGGILANIYLHRTVDYARIDQVMPDAPEYLPRGFPLDRVRTDNHWTDLSSYDRLPRGDTIQVDRPGPVTLGRAAFPIWRVTRDGRAVATHGPLISFRATPGSYRLERVRLWQESMGAAISLLSAILLVLIALPLRSRGISHLSKFPAYSPYRAIFDRPLFGWLGRSRPSGGEL